MSESSWFEKLLKLIHSLKPEIQIKPTINIHIGDRVSGDKIDSDGKDQIYIYPNILSPEQKKQFLDSLKDGIIQKKLILLQKDAQKLLKDYKSHDPSLEDAHLLNALQEFIPNTDLIALKASLYLRTKYKEGLPVNSFKMDIIKRFGVRGRNISNLCTSGYFEGLVLPLLQYFESIKDMDSFNKLYDRIIQESAFAIFVSNSMPDHQLKDEILSRIEKNKKYGLNHLNVHGIGKMNIRKIKDILSELADSELFDIAKEESVAQKFIFIKLDIKSKT